MDMTNDNFFGGEVVLIYLANTSEFFAGGIPVLNPVVEDKAGCKFIVGKMPSDPGDWSSDMPVGVALNQVAHYLVFSSLEEYIQKSEFARLSDSSVQ